MEKLILTAQPERAFVVHSGERRYPIREGVTAIGLPELAALLANTGNANTGNANTGNANAGDPNGGDANSGDANGGDANAATGS